MFIKSISMENFRCHKNTEVIFFPEGKQGNISIIEGGDGDGKTTIFNAIGWCLFGQETSELLEESKQSLGILNVSSLKDEGLSKISVEIWLGFEDSVTSEDSPISARVLRKAQVKGMTVVDEDISIELYPNEGNPKILYDSVAKNYIENKIPSDLIEFYMFNGEYLKDTKNTKGDNINTSIKRQFKTGSLLSMEGLLRQLGAIYRENATRASKMQNSNITNDISDLENSIAKNLSKKEGDENDLNIYQEKVKDAQGEMTKLRDQKIQIESKRELLKELSNKKVRKKDIINDFKKEMNALLKAQIEYGYLILSKNTMAEAYSKIKSELGKGNLPPNIKREFVADLISMHECICGRDLPEGSNEIERIKEILNESGMENNKSIMLEISPQINATLQLLDKKVPEMLENLRNSIKLKQTELRELEKEIEDSYNMETSLTKDEESIFTKYEIAEKNFNNFQALANGKEKELKRLKEKISYDNEQLQRLYSKQEKMVSKVSEAMDFQKWANMTKIYGEVLINLREKITDVFINSLQEEVNKLISSIKGLSHLSIRIRNVGGSIKVDYTDSYLTLDNMVYISEGQNQIISIALIAAYTSVLRNLGNGIAESPFIVMDHPFSDLGLPRKEELLKSFRTLFAGTKLIILTPPGDFDFNTISDSIASHYSVKNDPEKKVCNLVVK